MDNNQSLNNTENISLATTEIFLSYNARFWILLLFDIPSVACALFVLFCIFIDRKLRSNIKNHVLVIILLLGIGSQLIDVPFYLNFIVHSSVVPSKPSTCLLWWFVNIGMYDGGVIFMAWTAFERHIIVFHEQWISTRKRRIIVHYFPMCFLILYIFIYYIYAIYYFPCENTYDYTLPFCNEFPCYAYDPIMGIWDWIVNIASPTFLEALLSKHHLVSCPAELVWNSDEHICDWKPTEPIPDCGSSQTINCRATTRWATNGNVIVGVGNELGRDSQPLNLPGRIFIDTRYGNNVYVVDGNNYRVQKFFGNSLASNGITVVGGNGYGSEPNQLKSPVDVYVYAADSSNHRIQMWPKAAPSGITVVDTEGTGEYENRVDYFHSMFFLEKTNTFY
ncbi:unnamed protein product [Rotaria magnacalcarata]|uniref:Uncharacterized protein n=1 Tax=Rotaria magnacalcarata TaxID=392030 RepID=A0A820ED02_9BILA|nr:unnamed protein product [Rotaria magnacalcarata]